MYLAASTDGYCSVVTRRRRRRRRNSVILLLSFDTCSNQPYRPRILVRGHATCCEQVLWAITRLLSRSRLDSTKESIGIVALQRHGNDCLQALGSLSTDRTKDVSDYTGIQYRRLHSCLRILVRDAQKRHSQRLPTCLSFMQLVSLMYSSSR